MSARRFHPATLAVVTLLSAAVVMPLAGPAGADELISIPVDGVHRGPEGTTATVASVSVPPALVGQTCLIVGETVNQRSVHPGNDLLVVTGGQTFVIPDFEDAGDIVHDAGATEAIGETIELIVRFGPDGASSGGFKVFVTCGEPVGSEATVPATPETTAPATSDTTVPGTSDTTETTVAVAPSTTETTETTETTVDEVIDDPAPTADPVPTIPAGPVVDDTLATPSTTTPAPDVATTRTTAAAPPPAGPTTAQLPLTGSSTGWLVGAGLGLIMAGVAFVRRSRTASA